jgi:hypothetical protein
MLRANDAIRLSAGESVTLTLIERWKAWILPSAAGSTTDARIERT